VERREATTSTWQLKVYAGTDLDVYAFLRKILIGFFRAKLLRFIGCAKLIRRLTREFLERAIGTAARSGVVAHFDRKITRTTLIARVLKPFLLSHHVAKPVKDELFAFIADFSEKMRGWVREAAARAAVAS
jgi:hypothetical protein